MPKEIASDQIISITQQQLDGAYQWLCHQRKDYPPNSDIWTFRHNWQKIKSELLKAIISGNYVFSPLKRIHKQDGQVIHLWCSQDALVLKVLAEPLQTQLKLSKSCMHLKGHGGLKQCVAGVQQRLENYQFIYKTDVKSFYESIDQSVLVETLYALIKDKSLRRYLYLIIHRTVEYGGNYREITQGISRGSPLSPILGGLYLKVLDDALGQNKHCFYIRYMDDILIMTKTRWQNRKAVKQMNECFNQLKVEQHPDKTFIGKIEKGFDFLGYHFSREPLRVANITVKKHAERLVRLYEQQKTKNATPEEMASVLGQYVRRWQRWCSAGF